mmetsp:Transcript_12808/g.14693  ORF Transcript_12808/g.14693 Transcript_12808/m.14693 type:complete len:149 (-) Transcript_12808:986-1432(-)
MPCPGMKTTSSGRMASHPKCKFWIKGKIRGEESGVLDFLMSKTKLLDLDESDFLMLEALNDLAVNDLRMDEAVSEFLMSDFRGCDDPCIDCEPGNGFVPVSDCVLPLRDILVDLATRPKVFIVSFAILFGNRSVDDKALSSSFSTFSL